MHHKHGSGDTVTYYGTEGAGVSFIGNKSTIETSEGGRVALNLFKKFIEGKCEIVMMEQHMCNTMFLFSDSTSHQK